MLKKKREKKTYLKINNYVNKNSAKTDFSFVFIFLFCFSTKTEGRKEKRRTANSKCKPVLH